MEKCLRDRNHVKWNILLAIQANQNIKCETIGIAIENRCETQIACYYLTIYMAINIFLYMNNLFLGTKYDSLKRNYIFSQLLCKY